MGHFLPRHLVCFVFEILHDDFAAFFLNHTAYDSMQLNGRQWYVTFHYLWDGPIYCKCILYEEEWKWKQFQQGTKTSEELLLKINKQTKTFKPTDSHNIQLWIFIWQLICLHTVVFMALRGFSKSWCPLFIKMHTLEVCHQHISFFLI